MALRVAVVGGGILGAAVAWYLARGGARVTVFDAASEAATPASFAWINASWGNPPAYRALRMVAMAEWRVLGAAVPEAAPDWCGGLLWDLPEADLRAFADEAAAAGYALRLVDAAGARRLEPALAVPPRLAVHAPGEGMVEPVAAARALIAASGAEVRIGRVTPGEAGAGLSVAGERFDRVVLAAGTGTPDLLRPLGLEIAMHAPAGMLVWSEPLPRLLGGLVMMPDMHLRQTPEGRIVIGEDFAGRDPGPEAQAVAARLIAGAARHIMGAADLRLSHVTLGRRPTPGDGFPAVGRLGRDDLYLVLSHSGVTLAPALGKMVAAEILTGLRDPLLAPYDPARLVPG